MNPFDQAWALLKGQQPQRFFERYPDISYYQDEVMHYPPDVNPWGEDSEVMYGTRLSGGPSSHRAEYDKTAFSRTTMNPQIAAILARYARKPKRVKYPRITHMNDANYDFPETSVFPIPSTEEGYTEFVNWGGAE